jgi:hypothetical protein
LCLDVRGTPATDVETWFFVSDDDGDKRAKVAEWLASDDAARVILAKKLGVPQERLHRLRVRLAPDGSHMDIEVAEDKPVVKGQTLQLAFDTDGQRLFVVDGRTGRTVLRGRLTDPKNELRTLEAWIEVAAADRAEPQKPRPSNTGARGQDNKQGVVVQGTMDAGQFFGLMFTDEPKPKGGTGRLVINDLTFTIGGGGPSDAEFLKRVLNDVRGSGPTTLEMKYFAEDKDPKKREKLLETLLKDPGVQKKLGDTWKKKMLAGSGGARHGDAELLFFLAQDPKQPEGQHLKLVANPAPNKPANPTPPTPAAPQAGRFEKLVGELLAAKKPDGAILEALTLAAHGRLPTDNEKKIVLATIGTVTDRKAAWVAVAKALAGSEEPKKVETLELHWQVAPNKPVRP